jgi:hypothetical protein
MEVLRIALNANSATDFGVDYTIWISVNEILESGLQSSGK